MSKQTTADYAKYAYNLLCNTARYQLTCLRRGYHNPNPDDVKILENNPKFSQITHCMDCGFALELKFVDNDDGKYWVMEI